MSLARRDFTRHSGKPYFLPWDKSAPVAEILNRVGRPLDYELGPHENGAPSAE